MRFTNRVALVTGSVTALIGSASQNPAYLRNLRSKVESGLPITEMQADLLGDLGEQYGIR